jgi:hypothetical protein
VIGGTAVYVGGRFSVGLSPGTNNTHPSCCSGLGGSLVDNEVKDDLHPPGMSLLDQPVAVCQRAVVGVDVLVIGDIVSLMDSRTANVISRLDEVAQRASMHVGYPYHISFRAFIMGRYPDRIDAEIMLEIIQ